MKCCTPCCLFMLAFASPLSWMEEARGISNLCMLHLHCVVKILLLVGLITPLAVIVAKHLTDGYALRLFLPCGDTSTPGVCPCSAECDTGDCRIL